MRLKCYSIVKRLCDVLFSLLGLLLLLPFFIIIAIGIVTDSKGGIFFIQKRVGKNSREFSLIKFRTMHTGAEREGRLTKGNSDKRITGMGKILRKFKIDELPQLINVFTGRMSLVGPRPEVKEHVSHYSREQLKVLLVKPGLTDYGSLKYIHESDMLDNSDKPEQLYIERILPEKLKLNLEYINKRNIYIDIVIIFRTLYRIMRTIHFGSGKKN